MIIDDRRQQPDSLHRVMPSIITSSSILAAAVGAADNHDGDHRGVRGGSGNSDSVISGSLASAKPPRGGDTKERGNEEDETEPRSDL